MATAKKHPFKTLFTVACIIPILLFSVFFCIFTIMTSDARLDDSKISTGMINNIILFDRNDAPIKTKRGESYVKYSGIPEDIIKAFVAAEDKRFFSHNGVDILRILGAIRNDIKAGALKEGASTINQQLIKNTHLTAEKTLKRKMKEIRLAIELDGKYSKEKIMEAYLNGLYFGNGIYGIKNAAKMFFDKDLKSLNLTECATIAAVVKNPSRFSPLKNPQNSYERRNLILRQMKDNNFITEEQELAARVKKISVSDKKHEETINAAYVEGVLDEASKITGLTTKELLLSEYKIYTYFDEQEQKILYGAVTDEAHLLKNKNGKLPDAMSMIVDNHDGGINAFYINSYINNIFDLRRQPGSAAKPIFVYAPAFSENLITPLTKIDDVKKSFDGYSPSNFKEKYAGRTTVRNLVMQSSNVSAVEILKMLTVEKSKAFALTMGIELDKSDGVNIALGGLRRGLTPIELISGYTMLANSGNYKDIGFIKKICDQNGNLIYEKGLSYKSIISAEDAYIMTDILKDTAKRGTAKLLSPLTFDTASKTGTVSNNTDKSLNNDAWNLSYTTCHTILCWQGNLSNKTENALSSQVTGGGYPTLVAKEILSKLYTGFLPADFERPDGIVDYDGDILKVSDIMRAKNEDSRIDM